MGRSKDIATSAKGDADYVNVSGDTMTGGLTVDAGNGNQLLLDNDGERFTQVSFKNSGSQYAAVWYDNSINVLVNHAASGKGYVVQTGGSTDRLVIDSSGRVTMPYQPAFMAYGSGTYTNRGTGAIEYSTAVFNQGNHYSTSTYTFTAPVSGVYHFSAGAIAHASFTAAGGIFIEKNSTHYLKDYQETGSRSRTVSGTINCAANDAIKVRIESSGSGGDYYYLGAGYGWFSGHLIG